MLKQIAKEPVPKEPVVRILSTSTAESEFFQALKVKRGQYCVWCKLGNDPFKHAGHWWHTNMVPAQGDVTCGASIYLNRMASKMQEVKAKNSG